ncbi:MAG: hypothetical protein GF364_03025 [Candidatus Lokiarchaeota archaeon]|nr:hypothetical protein [Candidatus Lokiarchaeota archaeon]
MSTIVKIDIPQRDEFISQGDIFRDLKYIYCFHEMEKYVDVVEITFPYVIVLSQACDMKGMYEIINNNGKSTKQMISVLVAPLFDKSKVQNGDYLKKILGTNTPSEKGFSSKDKSTIENDFHYRFHFLNFESSFLEVPDSVIDFKQYFTLNIDILYKNVSKRICTLQPIFKEQVTLKFSTYLTRVAIP